MAFLANAIFRAPVLLLTFDPALFERDSTARERRHS
jgi:hypothetical protein